MKPYAISLYIPGEAVRILDEKAAAAGISREEFVNHLILSSRKSYKGWYTRMIFTPRTVPDAKAFTINLSFKAWKKLRRWQQGIKVHYRRSFPLSRIVRQVILEEIKKGSER